MRKGSVRRDTVRVVEHLPDGITKVIFEHLESLGVMGEGVYSTIRTEAIPSHLRQVGSRFVMVQQRFVIEKGDSLFAKDLRAVFDANPIRVEELS